MATRTATTKAPAAAKAPKAKVAKETKETKKTTKKADKFGALDAKAAVAKHKELTKELIKARLSLDPATVTAEGGLNGLNRDLKALTRTIAGLSKNRGKK